jgi:hypothetical protein
VIALKHLDPLVGTDVHLIQPPAPVPPIPVPHPYVGMVMDPADYIPMVGGTIMVNGMMRALAATAGQAMPPHIPIGGTFVKPPTNESEIHMGSAMVAANGGAMAFMTAPLALSCQDIGMPAPPRKRGKPIISLVLPTTSVIPIPSGASVMVGGAPSLVGGIAPPPPPGALGGVAKLGK